MVGKRRTVEQKRLLIQEAITRLDLMMANHTASRNLAVFALHCNKYSMTDIASYFHVSRQRISHIIQQMAKIFPGLTPTTTPKEAVELVGNYHKLTSPVNENV